jgi:hypothetical protein
MLRSVCLIVFSATLAVLPVRAQRVETYTLDDVVTLLQAREIGRDVLTSLIRSGCLGFVLDSDATTRLQRVGADAAFLSTLRTNCFAGAELVVTSNQTGAQVQIDGQNVGRTPYTVRYVSPRTVRVVVSAGGQQVTQNVALQARQRSRAVFSLPEPLVATPAVRNPSEIATALRLAERWQNPVAAPARPGMLPELGFIPMMAITLGAGAAGYSYCGGDPPRCFDTNSDPDDEDARSTRQLTGYLGGMAIGMAFSFAVDELLSSANSKRLSRWSRERQRWEAESRRAYQQWVRVHPDVGASQQSDRLRQQQVAARNAEIRTRNAALPPSRVTTEALPGPQR